MEEKRAFTLVELLVIATIVGLLSVAGIVSFSKFGKNSRDTRRKADIEQIRAALEIYKSNDTNGSYPVDYNDLTTGNYLKEWPNDPRGPTPYITYSPKKSDGTGCALITDPCSSYTLSGQLESGEIYEADPYGGTTITSAPIPSPTP